MTASRKVAYSPIQTWLNRVGVIAFIFCSLFAVFIISQNLSVQTIWWIFPSAFLALLAADFAAGLAHWAADTWGKTSWPVIGPVLSSFRNHHSDPKSIVRHPFLERNGDNCMLSLPLLIASFFLQFSFAAMTFSLFVIVMGFTNQFHSWAHMDYPPKFIRFLQRWNILLSPKIHQVHHTSPFATHYCITTGWLNVPLSFTRFFAFLEWVITTTTGAIPRQDDIGTGAALQVMGRSFKTSVRSNPITNRK